MKNQTRRTKKLAKKRKTRGSYERKRNVNRQPPSELKAFKKERVVPFYEENGKIKRDKKGEPITKTVIRKITKRVKKVLRDKNGKQYLPAPLKKSKKIRLNKTQKREDKKARFNAMIQRR